MSYQIYLCNPQNAYGNCDYIILSQNVVLHILELMVCTLDCTPCKVHNNIGWCRKQRGECPICADCRFLRRVHILYIFVSHSGELSIHDDAIFPTAICARAHIILMV